MMACWVSPPPRTLPTIPPSPPFSATFSASTGEVSKSLAHMVASISTWPISSVAVSRSMSRYLAGPSAVPPLEEVAHHYAHLAPLAAYKLLHLLGEDGVWGVGLGVVLEPLGVREHLRSFPSVPEEGHPWLGLHLHRCSHLSGS